MYILGSFSQKLVLWSNIKGCLVQSGMPVFWLTINLSDLRNPLVLILARIEFSGDALPKANATVCYAATTSNSVVVVQFFNYIYKAIFKSLLCSNTSKIRILGQVQNYFWYC